MTGHREGGLTRGYEGCVVAYESSYKQGQWRSIVNPGLNPMSATRFKLSIVLQRCILPADSFPMTKVKGCDFGAADGGAARAALAVAMKLCKEALGGMATGSELGSHKMMRSAMWVQQKQE